MLIHSTIVGFHPLPLLPNQVPVEKVPYDRQYPWWVDVYCLVHFFIVLFMSQTVAAHRNVSLVSSLYVHGVRILFSSQFLASGVDTTFNDFEASLSFSLFTCVVLVVHNMFLPVLTGCAILGVSWTGVVFHCGTHKLWDDL